MALNGHIVIISLNGTAIAGAKSCEIQTECETIEISSATQGQWMEIITGRKKWSVNVGYLVMAIQNSGQTQTRTLTDLLAVGLGYTITIGDHTTAVLTGNAIMTTCKISAVLGNLANGSFVFQGNGQLTTTTNG